MSKGLSAVGAGLFLVGFFFYLGFGITSFATAPSYAVVFVDMPTKTFIAPSCLEDWRYKHGKAEVVLSNIGEASKAGFTRDNDCKESGAFQQDARSLSGAALEKIGLLSPIQFWWDKPYRTEDGMVYPPETKPRK